MIPRPHKRLIICANTNTQVTLFNLVLIYNIHNTDKARLFLTTTQGYYEDHMGQCMEHCTANWIKRCMNVRDDLTHLHIFTGKFGIGKYSFEITFLREVQGFRSSIPQGF